MQQTAFYNQADLKEGLEIVLINDEDIIIVYVTMPIAYISVKCYLRRISIILLRHPSIF